MTGEQILTIIVSSACIVCLVIILIRIIVCRDRVFQTKKSYERECREYEERRRRMNNDYPDLVSRLSWFFELSEDEIKDEIRRICNEASSKET